MEKTSHEDKFMMVRVGVYGEDWDELEKIAMEIGEFMIQKNGWWCQELEQVRSDLILAIIVAKIPVKFAREHHGFDSRLNSTTTGYGVAWVEEI